MKVQTKRFGELELTDSEVIVFPRGILGFPDYTRYCLVDPADETLILWLQSLDYPELAFAVLEPKIFKPDYIVKLSASEMRELKLQNINEAAVYTILTIPEKADEMSANLKAPLVINLQNKLAKQVVLQENEYNVHHPMFKELKKHLVVIKSQKQNQQLAEQNPGPVTINNIPASSAVKSLELP